MLLTGRDGKNLVLCTTKGGMRISADNYLGARRALQVHRVDDERFQLYTGDSCGGPWRKWDRTITSNGLRAKPVLTKAGPDYMLQLSLGNEGSRYYRGDIIAIHTAGTIRTVNDVDTEAVVRSVIAREMSPSWGDSGGGRGQNALRAQAVAARSYMIAGDSRWGTIATTCDSTTCQVYQGVRIPPARLDAGRPGGGSPDGLRDRGDREADPALPRRSGGPDRVLLVERRLHRRRGLPGPARRRRRHVDQPQPRLVGHGRPRGSRGRVLVRGPGDLGNVQLLTVSSRNGLGSFGGRALTVRAVFDGGDITVSGDQFRQLFALKSNWFIIRST